MFLVLLLSLALQVSAYYIDLNADHLPTTKDRLNQEMFQYLVAMNNEIDNNDLGEDAPANEYSDLISPGYLKTKDNIGRTINWQFIIDSFRGLLPSTETTTESNLSVIGLEKDIQTEKSSTVEKLKQKVQDFFLKLKEKYQNFKEKPTQKIARNKRHIREKRIPVEIHNVSEEKSAVTKEHKLTEDKVHLKGNKSTETAKRHKRSVPNDVEEQNTNEYPNEMVDKPVSDVKNETDNVKSNNTSNLKNNNETDYSSSTSQPPCNSTDQLPDGRRSYGRSHESSSDVKIKLLEYLDSGFKELYQKMEPISKIKFTYLNHEVYKIGYIIANIDTLEANIKNMKNELDENKQKWDDKKILDMFDKVMLTNKVVSNLVDALNGYMKKQTSLPVDMSMLTNNVVPTI